MDTADVTTPRTLRYRWHTCRVCGHTQVLQTNHTHGAFGYCHQCSWKGFGHDSDHSALLRGQAQRWFDCTEGD